jgi:hypothetical protein
MGGASRGDAYSMAMKTWSLIGIEVEIELNNDIGTTARADAAYQRRRN